MSRKMVKNSNSLANFVQKLQTIRAGTEKVHAALVKFHFELTRNCSLSPFSLHDVSLTEKTGALIQI